MFLMQQMQQENNTRPPVCTRSRRIATYFYRAGRRADRRTHGAITRPKVALDSASETQLRFQGLTALGPLVENRKEGADPPSYLVYMGHAACQPLREPNLAYLRKSSCGWI